MQVCSNIYHFIIRILVLSGGRTCSRARATQLSRSDVYVAVPCGELEKLFGKVSFNNEFDLGDNQCNQEESVERITAAANNYAARSCNSIRRNH